jgi:hypothetical protein
MALGQGFCQPLGLQRLRQRCLRPAPRARAYQPAELVVALLDASIGGLDRLNATQILEYNGAFQRIVGLPQFPDASTLRRFLRRLRPRPVRQLGRRHDQLRQARFARPRPRTSLGFDVDSVVWGVAGHAEGARVGYNPTKRGRRAYHPWLCFAAHRQEFWHGRLRPGNTVAAPGAVPFRRRCLAKVPPGLARARIRVRADSGFFGHRVPAFLEGAGVGYALGAKEHKLIQAAAQGCRFRRLASGWAGGECRSQAGTWPRARRCVVVRRPIPAAPVEAKPLTLFPDRQYAYPGLVTNLRTHPWRVWRFSAQRARIEQPVRERLSDYPLAKIPTAEWVANVAFFQLRLFAFDLIHYFRRLCLPPAYQAKPLKTVRLELLVIPGRLVKAKTRYCLRLPDGYPFESAFRHARGKIAKVRPVEIQ